MTIERYEAAGLARPKVVPIAHALRRDRARVAEIHRTLSDPVRMARLGPTRDTAGRPVYCIPHGSCLQYFSGALDGSLVDRGEDDRRPGPMRVSRPFASSTMNPDELLDTEELLDTVEITPPSPGLATPARRPSASVQADLAGQSHQGKVRPNNEDHFLIVRFGRSLRTVSTNLPDDHAPPDHEEAGYGLVVADGMGGMAAGEAASRMAITRFIELVLATPDWILAPEGGLLEEVMNRAVERFRRVNEAVVERSRHDPGLVGMGTTLTMAMSLGTDLLIAHVGDSPAYLFRQGELHRLTRDHTLAQELADYGRIPARDVASHRYRNVLTQAIGIRGTGGEPDVRRLQLTDGDRLLLCTDGLTEMVDDATIATELGRPTSAAEACRALIDQALDRGGKDNVTVVVADYRLPERDRFE